MSDEEWEDMELEDIPKPYKRYYDDKRRKRKLFIEITTWRYVSIGARHYYAKVREDDNPINYNGTNFHFSEDKEKDGKEFGGVMNINSSFNTLQGAIDWAVNVVVNEFPDHRIYDMSGNLVTLKEFKDKVKKEKNGGKTK
jgi:hypothetical protein